MNKIKPSALYIHIPFCADICGYCDFPKIKYFPHLAKEYLEALNVELATLNIKHPLETIYIGGGTPTALSDEDFLVLMKMVYPYTKEVKEYTVEANPESLTINKLQIMKKYGVNRLSIGVQSTSDKVLKLLNRHHDFDMVKKVIKQAREEGFNNISCDLILGLPQCGRKTLIKDIDNILSLGIDHLSCYALSVHPHTPFALKGIKEKDDQTLRNMYDIIEERVTSKGYLHYEISNYAKKGKESLHNLTYWNDDTYYGIGLGAASYFDDKRRKNTLNLHKYLAHEFVMEETLIDKNEDINYFLMLNLRKASGLSYQTFFHRFGFNLKEEKKETISRFCRQGYLKDTSDYLAPTYQGMMILDTILLELMF